jgi:DNA-directed RNA polymerase specialized sigma24 family protein
LSAFSKVKLLFLGRQWYVTQISDQETAQYATGADFCHIFVEEMHGLYLLSLLLTGDDSLAETCFVQGLEDSRGGKPVFKEWARSWARRTIIQRAIQLIRPQTTPNSSSSPTSAGGVSRAMTQPAEIANIVGLPQFERFVFVMSVIERYSPQECSLLLNCTRRDVIAARTWALQQIARAAELPEVVSIDSDDQALPDDHLDDPVIPLSPPGLY